MTLLKVPLLAWSGRKQPREVERTDFVATIDIRLPQSGFDPVLRCSGNEMITHAQI